MRKFTLAAVALSALFAIAANARADDAAPLAVTFKLDIKQPSLFDNAEHDTFNGTVDDVSGTTNLMVVCSAGASGFLGIGRVDEACIVTGKGSIKNPKNPTITAQRIEYGGGFKIEGKKDGYTNASTIMVNYLRSGSSPAESTSFGGNLRMKPENPSASAKALSGELLDYLASKNTGTEAVKFDTKIDSIRFDSFEVPHVGQKNTKSCTWTGDQIYAYANNSWTMKFDVACGDQKFQLEGNMPLVDVTGTDHQQEYRLNLVVPGEDNADPFAAADPFSVVKGVTGTFKLKNSGRSTPAGVFEFVKVDGQLQGNGVPLELVRDYGEIMTVLARTFFGA